MQPTPALVGVSKKFVPAFHTLWSSSIARGCRLHAGKDCPVLLPRVLGRQGATEPSALRPDGSQAAFTPTAEGPFDVEVVIAGE